MQQRRRRSGLIFGLLALGLLTGAALTANLAQAVDAVGPYYALPSWDRKMGVVNRFVVLTNWGGAAVLDKETGLVWERTPANIVVGWENPGATARKICTARTTGGHKGWRLPSITELTSVIDLSVAAPGPTLPPGHPFNVAPTHYWSATTDAGFLFSAWYVDFRNGGVGSGDKVEFGLSVWCVRGGMNADQY
jgi:hypothetical protein